ncbi:MAG: MoaD/ThiS family protein [Acidimicrobiia bacterium]|nr:MoaD/ThiS family protein [Acidimicrobiia bacterium]
MPTLRLFANLREAAGASQVAVAGDTVGDVIEAASEQFGEAFRLGLPSAKIWVNGDPADASTPVGTSDEIALIPPVSGGATATTSTPVPIEPITVLALLAGLIVANLMSLQWFTFAVVAAGIAWTWDLRDVVRSRGIPASAIPGSLAVGLAANGAYGWGESGFAGGLAIGVMVILAWSVIDGRLRTIDAVAVGTMLGVVGALGTGGITFVRLRDTGEVSFFVAVVGLAAFASWLVQRFAPDVAGLDPNLAALVVTLIAGTLLGLFTEVFTTPVALLAAVFIGLGLIGGRTLGSIVRWGPVMHTERAPGMLTVLDGFVVAAAAYFAAIILFG